MRRLRVLLLACLPLVLAAASGCKTYKYFDVQVKFDPATFTSTDVFTINVCQVTVTGADSDQFILEPMTCVNRSPVGNPLTGGKFEFSTFADSGTMTFKLDGYQGTSVSPACLIGSGMTSIKVTSTMTLTGDLTVAKTGNGCQ